LRRKPFDLIAHVKRRATTTTETKEHACLSQHAHGGLSDGSTCAQKDYSGIGDGNIKIEIVFFGLGEIQNSAIFLHDTAVF